MDLTVISTCLNTIFIPILICYEIKDKNIYGVGGLAEEVFYFALTSIFMSALFKLIPLTCIINRIKRYRYGRPWQKIKSDQKQYN